MHEGNGAALGSSITSGQSYSADLTNVDVEMNN